MSESLANYLRHAQRFGTDMVIESAAGLTPDELTRLRVELDTLDRQDKRRSRVTRRARPCGKAQATSEAVRVLAEDGLVPAAIRRETTGDMGEAS